MECPPPTFKFAKFLAWTYPPKPKIKGPFLIICRVSYDFYNFLNFLGDSHRGIMDIGIAVWGSSSSEDHRHLKIIASRSPCGHQESVIDYCVKVFYFSFLEIILPYILSIYCTINYVVLVFSDKISEGGPRHRHRRRRSFKIVLWTPGKRN